MEQTKKIQPRIFLNGKILVDGNGDLLRFHGTPPCHE